MTFQLRLKKRTKTAIPDHVTVPTVHMHQGQGEDSGTQLRLWAAAELGRRREVMRRQQEDSVNELQALLGAGMPRF